MISLLFAAVVMYASGDEYAAKYHQAVRDNKPLVVWVNCFSVATEAMLEDCLHCRVTEFPEAQAPCVVVSRPNGRGGLIRLADVPRGDVSSASIKAVLSQPRSSVMPVTWRAASPHHFTPRVVPFDPASGCPT